MSLKTNFWFLTETTILLRFEHGPHRPDFPRSGRIDFIDKKFVIDMSPEEFFTPGRLKTDFIHAFAKRMHGDCNLMVFSDSTRVASQEAAMPSEPNVVVVSRKTYPQR